MSIINNNDNFIEPLVKLINFNENIPELNNIYFFNITGKNGYVFQDNQFTVQSKKDILNKIYLNFISILGHFIENDYISDPLLKQKFKYIYYNLIVEGIATENTIAQKNKNNKLRNYIMNEIKITIYNNSNKKLFNILKCSDNLKRINSQYLYDKYGVL
jgi:hypothetical protein